MRINVFSIPTRAAHLFVNRTEGLVPFGMRLINVETWTLEEFFGDAIPPYAILSHTWGNDTDEMFREVHDGLLDNAHDTNKLVKLRECCQQAKEDHLYYVWIDTCCINKIDSVELGEAINSMFQWYSKASVCYAYLSDVPSSEEPEASPKPGSKFSSSRWFQRGWTLQELLAPNRLRFYDQSWKFLSTKGQMASAIEQIPGIPRAFLRGWLGLHQASVAQRMSWAAGRVTKRKDGPEGTANLEGGTRHFTVRLRQVYRHCCARATPSGAGSIRR